MYDLIAKKKRGGHLSADEIGFIVAGYVSGEVPPEQMAAFLMAVSFRGMSDAETTALTLAILNSGDVMDLSAIPGVKVDKHSTGGVGDKASLIVLPVVAACGGIVAKMSGRSLGHTGGTIDKLEAIPGFRVELSEAEFLAAVKKNGLAVISQSRELCPADKKIYALRDLTATVDSIPLIAASVMSKKLAAGADAILLDVTCGSGAFMKTIEHAIRLATTMVRIGESAGRKTAALITNMDVPLGCAVGNALEVAEAVEVLSGKGADDLREVSVALAANMLAMSGKGTLGACVAMAKQALDDGTALRKLCDMVAAQGGDVGALRDTSRLPTAPHRFRVLAPEDAYMSKMDAEKIGLASMALGAGREHVGDVPDPAAGIMLLKKPGEFVKRGETVALLFTGDESRLPGAREELAAAIRVDSNPPAVQPAVLAFVDKNGVERFDEK